MKTIIGTDVEQAADFLRRGELVAIPTETVYGLAGNALNEEAVLSIFKMKERPAFDPLIVHTFGIEKVAAFAQEIPEQAFDLMENFWPGPLTILLKKKNTIPDLVTSGLDTVAIRVPDHLLTLALLRQLDFPLAAPSANPFGYISPTTAQHVADKFDGKIPYILDGGQSNIGIESTIIGFESGECIIYRLGGMKISEIEKYTGKLKIQLNESSNPAAPGMMKSHYAPAVPLFFGEIEELLSEQKGKGAIICLTKNNRSFPTGYRITELSATNNLDEAARNLFAVMRSLDVSELDFILAEPMPDEGLGKAINDRLKRAASGK